MGITEGWGGKKYELRRGGDNGWVVEFAQAGIRGDIAHAKGRTEAEWTGIYSATEEGGRQRSKKEE